MTTTTIRKWNRLDDIDPAEWRYVGSVYTGSSEDGWAWAENAREAVDALEASTVSLFGQTGQCDHCGARPKYVIVTRHEPTGDVIAVGWQCVANRFAFADRAGRDVARLKKAAERARQEAARKAAAAKQRAEFAAEHPVEAKVLDEVDAAPEGRSEFLVDLAAKFARYGYLTENQLPWVQKCVEREEQARERDAERAEQDAALVPAPEGRVTVRGEVLTTKVVDGYFEADTIKMLVLSDDHYKVWTTVPSALLGNEPVKGRRVEFAATLTRSDRDECFAFGKRPSKARYIDEEEQ